MTRTYKKSASYPHPTNYPTTTATRTTADSASGWIGGIGAGSTALKFVLDKR